MRDHGGELLADFQQYYGLDLRALLDACDLERAYELAVNLPQGSRTLRALDPRTEWGPTEHLLALACDNLAFLRYEQAGGRGGRPKPVERPSAPKRMRRQETVHGMTAGQVAAALAAPRM